MPMTKLLADAFEEASKLPAEEQKIIAEIVISFLHPDEADEAEEAEWDALVQSPESQRFLDKMVKEVKEEEKNRRLLPFPGDK